MEFSGVARTALLATIISFSWGFSLKGRNFMCFCLKLPKKQVSQDEYSHKQNFNKDSGYPHDGRADKNPYPHDRRADKDSYPHDSNNQCNILRLQLSFVVINEQMMLV